MYSTITARLGCPASRITFHQVDFAFARISGLAICQFTWQAAAFEQLCLASKPARSPRKAGPRKVRGRGRGRGRGRVGVRVRVS